MSEEKKSVCNRYGVPSQAGIFLLSLHQGVLISNTMLVSGKVKDFLSQKFDDKFRVVFDKVKKVGNFPVLYLWFFEVKENAKGTD